MESIEKQMPIRQSLCGSLRRDGHWKCFCLTLLILICLTAISWCKIINASKPPTSYMESPFNNADQLSPCKEGYIYIPVAFVIMLYLVYLVECWHSHIRLELKYKVDIPTVYSTISDMQAAMPVIWWKATCYHYVRRTRQVMRYRNGDAFSSTQVYYERVDSSTAGAAFNFTQCGVKDISRPINNLEKFQAIKIKVSKGFSFASVDTEYEFEEQRAQFFQDYETRDDYMEGREGMDLMDVDFREYMIAFSNPNQLPWYVSHTAYWIASTLLLSWPLRAIIEYKTAHLHYHIHKLFGSNYVDAENYPNLMTRVNTMNSEDLEMSIRNNNVIVPSYSEAMLNNAFEMQTIRDYGATKSTLKFPRSLTNVTLAARCSTNVISNTPAITMNRVKRFNSCTAFGDQSSSEVLSNPGTIRNQISQIVRDRHRLNNKRNTLSSISVTGFPFSSRPSDRTPDGIESIRSSLSSYSVTSSRRPQSMQHDAHFSSHNSSTNLGRSIDLRQSIHEIGGQNTNARDSQTICIVPSRTSEIRPSSVSSPTPTSSSHHDQIISSTANINSPSSLSYHTASNSSPIPPRPAFPSPTLNLSPPEYEEAIRTCQIANHSPHRHQHNPVQSIPVSQGNITPNSQPSSRAPTQTSCDRPPYDNACPKRPTSIEPITSSRARVNKSALTSTPQPGFNFPDHSQTPPPRSTPTTHNNSFQFKLKPLPKVAAAQLCFESEDSESGCLHNSTISESDDVDSIFPVEHRGEVTPDSVRECQFDASDISVGEILASGRQNVSRVTLIQEHSTIGLSHGMGAVDGRADQCPCSPIRMETSV